MTRKVTLEPAFVDELLRMILQSSAAHDRRLQRHLDKAQDRLGAIVSIEERLDGTIHWTTLKGKAEYEFGKDELIGMKLALVQTITGRQDLAPAQQGKLRYMILPIARALGIEALVRKESGLDVGGEALDEISLGDEEKG